MRAGACGAAHRLLQVMTIFSVSAIAPIKMKTVFSALVACLLALTFSQASYAGAGYRFLLTNKMKPLAGDPGYPQLTVHVAGGYNCWYLNPESVFTGSAGLKAVALANFPPLATGQTPAVWRRHREKTAAEAHYSGL